MVYESKFQYEASKKKIYEIRGQLKVNKLFLSGF